MGSETDLDLTAATIAKLTSADALAAFFTSLRYRTDARKPMSAEAIGLAGDAAAPIRSIELLAEDADGFMRVVLVHLKSLTAKSRTDLTRVLGRTNVDHLLVLTSDFSTLEFVLLDKRRRDSRGPAGGQRIQVVPLVFAVDRKGVGTKELRILRRFTWTSRDGLEQFDKLRSVFEASAFTEDYFCNRALFADHYLTTRLQEDSAWKESPAAIFQQVKQLLSDARVKWYDKGEQIVRDELYEPLFQQLGFKPKKNKRATDDQTQPDYLLTDGAGSTISAAFTYAWDRWLDGPDYQLDRDTPDENPGACIVTALEEGVADWIIVTNGRQWRLYSRQAHSRATNFYEVDLPEALIASGDTDPNEAFRYWWLFFRSQAYVPDDATPPKCWLDHIAAGSSDYAKELGERLKGRIFEKIFPHLARGFLQDRRQRLGLKKSPSDDDLRDTFEGTLTLLYRLLFLLYAESRDLLPIREAPYHQASLKRIKEQVADKAGIARSDVDEQIGKAFSAKETTLYDRLQRLFAVMDKGDAAINVPTYNGGLFITQPDQHEAADAGEERELRIARFLTDHKVPDRALALAIDLLSRDEDPKNFSLVFIDYKSLAVRHLGSIYEGLLEFKLKIADEDLTTKTEKKREKYIPLAKAKKKRGRDPAVVVRKGDVYLSNDKAERKASGSYYTPDPIVEYIVEQTVGPVLAEKLEGLRKAFRKVRKTFDNEVQKATSYPVKKPDGSEWDPREFALEKVYTAHRDLVDQLFEFRTLDPAMGSGHFLVEAVDFITDRLLTFLNQFPINPVQVMLDRTRKNILAALQEQGVTVDPAKLTDVNLLKRHVLKRCIYGVDLNPMAVELAKVSLWLDAFTLGAPLSFLNHHLRCGNSLIGATFADLRDALKGRLFGVDYEPLLRAIRHVLFVNKMADATAAEVKQSASEYDQARRDLSGYQIILDLLVARHFSYPDAPEVLTHIGKELDLSSRERFEESLPVTDRLLIQKVAEVARRPELRFFHWEIEFPEVFYGFADADQRQLRHKDDFAPGAAGFDAVVGNPPYVRVQELRSANGSIVDYLKSAFRSPYKNFDLSVVFLERVRELSSGRAALISSNKWFATDYGSELRKLLASNRAIFAVVDFNDFRLFEDATTYTAIVGVSPRVSDEYEYVDASAGRIGIPLTRSHSTLPVDGSVWTFTSQEESEVLDIFTRRAEYTLGEIRDRAFQGLRTSDNPVYVLRGEVDETSSVTTLHSRATDTEVRIETAILRPLVPGDAIRAFSIRDSGEWLIFPYDLTGDRPRLLREQELKAGFPLAWSYLCACESRLRGREAGKMDRGKWWAFGRPQNLDQFEQPKIMLPDYHDGPAAALDLEGRYYSITAYCITLRDDTPLALDQLAALLNSDVLFWTLAKTGTALQRGFVRFMPQYLDQLPIVVPQGTHREMLSELTERARIEGFERVRDQLNQIVAKMYGAAIPESLRLLR